MPQNDNLGPQKDQSSLLYASPWQAIHAGKRQVMPQATGCFEEEKKRNLKLEDNITVQRNKSNKFHFSE
jgi:hypothetical protein